MILRLLGTLLTLSAAVPPLRDRACYPPPNSLGNVPAALDPALLPGLWQLSVVDTTRAKHTRTWIVRIWIPDSVTRKALWAANERGLLAVGHAVQPPRQPSTTFRVVPDTVGVPVTIFAGIIRLGFPPGSLDGWASELAPTEVAASQLRGRWTSWESGIVVGQVVPPPNPAGYFCLVRRER